MSPTTSSIPDLQPITVTLAMVGKVGIAAAFAVIYVWSAEIYPTVVRNAGMGASSAFARIGGMISPYIADIVRISIKVVLVNNFKRVFISIIYISMQVLRMNDANKDDMNSHGP